MLTQPGLCHSIGVGTNFCNASEGRRPDFATVLYFEQILLFLRIAFLSKCQFLQGSGTFFFLNNSDFLWLTTSSAAARSLRPLILSGSFLFIFLQKYVFRGPWCARMTCLPVFSRVVLFRLVHFFYLFFHHFLFLQRFTAFFLLFDAIFWRQLNVLGTFCSF